MFGPKIYQQQLDELKLTDGNRCFKHSKGNGNDE